MCGRQAPILVEAGLMYDTAYPESLNCTKHAAKIWESLSKVARKHIARKQDRQAETYKKKIHGNLHQVRTLVWFLNLQVPPTDISRLKGWNAGHMTAAQWKQGGESKYASIIAYVCLIETNYPPPFQLFSTEQCTIFVQSITAYANIFSVDEFLCSSLVGLCLRNWNYEC